MIPIKSESELAIMRTACRIAATVLSELCKLVAPGVNTYDLDQAGRKLLAKYDSRSACFGYQVGSKRFPAYTCLSVNDEIVHGIGTLKRVLADGDIVSVDVCVEYEGFIGDNARTVAVGNISEEKQKLLTVTEAALMAAIDQARSGNRVGAITYGPKNVLILVGRNKIVADLEDAIYRIKNYAAPVNAMRLDMKTPCVKSGRCADCKSTTRICNVWTISEKSFPKGRVKVVLINQELGM